MRQLPQSTELLDMLRSFTTLAGTLDLAETAQSLGVPRETVERHIEDLETLKGMKLFEVADTGRRLTVAGSQSAVEAESILNQMDHWLKGLHGHADYVGGLDHVEHVNESDGSYYSQQHPLDRLWIDSPPLLQTGFQAWSASRFRIDDPNMDEIRPYVIVYRKARGYWVCASVGEKSSLATWFGSSSGTGQVGSIMKEVFGDGGRARILTSTYSDVLVSSSARLDHVFAQIPHEKGAMPFPVSYQRLLCACRFSDGEPALMILVARTNRVQIASVDRKDIPFLPEHLLMEFDI